MAWQTPKTDWDSAGNPLPADFNRIEGNEAYLYDKFHQTTGHKHTGAAGDGPRLTAASFLWRALGDTILLQALTERATFSTTFICVKQFQVAVPGRYRVTGELRIYNGAYTASVQIRLSNGAIIGTFNTSSTSFVSFAFDLPYGVPAGEIISVDYKSSSAAIDAHIRNVYLRGVTTSSPTDAVLQD